MTERARTAWKLYRFARKRGHSPSFRLCYRIVDAARDTGTSAAVLAATVEKESGFRHIFGHDAGGWFAGKPVTEARYKDLRNHLRADWSGANGVGYVQVTYPPFITADGTLWKPKANLRWGARHLADLLEGKGSLASKLNAYNGDPTGQYGRDLAAIVRAYRLALN
jgi:hypothetical protein